METTGSRFNRISKGWNLIFVIILCLFAVMIVFPMLLVVMVSLSTSGSIAAKGYSLFPTEISFYAYENLAYTGTQIFNSYVVTIAQTALGTVLSLAVMAPYAFVLAQPNFPCRKFYTLFIFVTMLFSGGLVASYVMNVRYYKLYDSFWIYIFPSLTSAYNIIILRTFLQTNIPTSLFEAAKIDGASDFTIFVKIVLPLFKAGLATIGLFCVVGRWNDWFTGMLYIENPKLVTLQTLLIRIQNSIAFIKENVAKGQQDLVNEMLMNMPTESVQNAIVVIVTAPILFVYPFFQKYFVKGITIGSVKG